MVIILPVVALFVQLLVAGGPQSVVAVAVLANRRDVSATGVCRSLGARRCDGGVM